MEYDDDFFGVFVFLHMQDHSRTAEETGQVGYTQVEHITHLDAIIPLHNQL